MLFRSAVAAEARSDVDKLLNYVNDPDYGVWRNNALISCDEGDSNKHLFQAAGINDLLSTDIGTGLFLAKAYVDLLPRTEPSSKVSMPKEMVSPQLKENSPFSPVTPRPELV